MLNIPSTIKDPNYRYKMPKLSVTIQGSGGNTKTKLDNIKDLAAALTCPADYPLKFIGKELGAQTDIKNDLYLINGNHTSEKLAPYIDKFIEKYILCPKCKLPESRIFIKKGEIRCKCRACGGLSKLDDKHKFSNHIKNFPPKYDDEMESKRPNAPEGKEGKGEKKITLDKEMKIKIKSTIDRLSKLVSSTSNSDGDGCVSKIESVINELKVEMCIKYFILINGIFDKNIYQQLKNRLPYVKNILSKEEENNKEEAIFHILVALADLTSNRFKDIGKYVSSILYYFYLDDVFGEEFWLKYAVMNSISNSSSPFFTSEIEGKFLENAKEFTHWIEYAPYEDEVDKSYGGINSVPKKEVKVEEDLNIDDI